MGTFVLVHGGWRGGWCYSRVARLLRDAGHDVFTPTLTGLGERSHLMGLNINLSTHVTDIANVLHWEDLDDVVLCGHSYGGMVVTGVAGQMGDRIRSLFYLDAFVPAAGQSLFDLLPAAYREPMIAAARDNQGRSPTFPPEFFGTAPEHHALVERNSTDHPLDCYIEGIRLGDKLDMVTRRTFVMSTRFPGSVYQQFYDLYKVAAGWRTTTIESGHDIMIDEPESLRELLIDELARD
ncbi:alpha/beta hydrolase [Sphingomonas sp. AP4-R1]|uniref:alpha/beta fold hydrolase n=1 Tax=Sphingomonas sp. AP4-R1 TaxID=2735134 RepID=UPI001493982E|nr:alpha/beta hydrolase family protein [Sphingomonas sp. AP4-R1]QJU58175.1 alpha/beta hydrolase [Sphingomonas sp. AP4-R1]